MAYSLAALHDMLQYPYIQNALLASGLIAVLAATVGWFMVLRAQTYIGHTMSLVGFPGATVAAFFGVTPLIGFVVACCIAAICIQLLQRRGCNARSASISWDASSVNAIVQTASLALGLVVASQSAGFLGSTSTFLFGSITGISQHDVALLAIIAVVVFVGVLMMGRMLHFASVDAAVAAARGIHVHALSLVFILLLALSIAGACPLTGSLLVFTLMTAPPLAAQNFTLTPSRSIMLTALFAMACAWSSIAIGFFTNMPIGFFLALHAFFIYVVSWIFRRTSEQSRSSS